MLGPNKNRIFWNDGWAQEVGAFPIVVDAVAVSLEVPSATALTLTPQTPSLSIDLAGTLAALSLSGLAASLSIGLVVPAGPFLHLTGAAPALTLNLAGSLATLLLSASAPSLTNAAAAAFVTNIASIRDHMVARISALTPTLLSGDKFRVWRNEGKGDFQSSSPQFRRFQVRATVARNYDSSVVALDGRSAEFTVTVAYPQNHRTGGYATLDRDDAMSADQHAIETAIGVRGYRNFDGGTGEPTAYWLEGSTTRVKGATADFLVITQTLRWDLVV